MPQVVTAITALFTAFTTSAIGTFLTTTFVGRLLTAVALSALSQALKKKPPTPGIRGESTTAGGDNPQGFILGQYATGGTMLAPMLTHGTSGGTPNAFLTYVIALGDIPGQQLTGLILNDEYVSLTGAVHPEYGTGVAGAYAGYLWVKYYNGTQVTADPMMLAKYGSHPSYPWQSDMIGRGVCYAIVTFLFKREVYNTFPKVRFVLNGIPLYDPRMDSTVGGSGAQRWSNRATWAPTMNPMVMTYNIKRGITLPDGSVWGGRSAAADLPLSNWFAAMNACDAVITTTAGSEPAYRAGFEVYLADEPATVEEELLKVCAGNVAEFGGVWRARVGPPAAPVYAITDEDVLFSEERQQSMFPGLDQTFNGIHATYPEPQSLWETKEAPPRYNATWEATDLSRRLVADLQLPACPFGGQVQRLMQGYINEERRFRRHVIVLPPDAAMLEPLDSIAWTSAANGYTNKIFEVAEVSDKLMTGCQIVSLRERDSADFNWSVGLELPSVPVASLPIRPGGLGVPSFDVDGITLNDAAGHPRRPALQLTWDASQITGVDGLEYEVRLQSSGAIVARNWVRDFEAGWHVVPDGVLPGLVYEARARFTSRVLGTVWSAWLADITPSVFLTNDDFENGIQTLFHDQNMFAIRDVASLPAAGVVIGDKVYNRADGKLYEWDGSAWVLVIAGAAPASITALHIAANTITGGLMSASGIITNTAQINDGLITTAKIGNLQVDTLNIADGAVTVPAFVAYNNNVSVTNSGVSVASLSVTSQGFSAYMTYSCWFQSSSNLGGWGALGEVFIDFYRNGSLLTYGSFGWVIGARQKMRALENEVITFSQIDPNPPPGLNNYTINMTTGLSGQSGFVFQRSFSIHQFKK